MSKPQKPAPTERSIYKKLLSQVRKGYWSGHVHLTSVEFSWEDVVEYPNEPVENMTTTWQYSFEKTGGGFLVHVLLRNEIPSEEEDKAIELEIGYTLNYQSEMELPASLVERFAYDIVLPQVWPYFREYAKELYFKAGLLWVVIPFEPSPRPR